MAGLMCVGSLSLVRRAAAQEPCFQRLDNGVDTTGWQRSTTNHHGPALGWTVEDGAMVGRQTAGQLGGIMMTTRTYRDVEVVFEVKIDWGCDSGLFLRTTGGDRAYQVNVDHLTGGGIGTIYGESFATLLRVRDFTLTDQGNTAVVEPGRTPLFDLSRWSTIWHPTEFNEIRARIEGNPPHIQAWISNVKVSDFTDDQIRSEIDPAGPLAIQVHATAERWTPGGAVRFRNIRAKDLTAVCVVSDAGDARPPNPDAGVASDARSDVAREASSGIVEGGPTGDVASVDVGSNADGRSSADAELGVDARSSADRDADPVPPTQLDAASDSGAASNAGAPSESGSGCACRSSRRAGDASAPAMFFVAWAGARMRRRSRTPPSAIGSAT